MENRLIYQKSGEVQPTTATAPEAVPETKQPGYKEYLELKGLIDVIGGKHTSSLKEQSEIEKTIESLEKIKSRSAEEEQRLIEANAKLFDLRNADRAALENAMSRIVKLQEELSSRKEIFSGVYKNGKFLIDLIRQLAKTFDIEKIALDPDYGKGAYGEISRLKAAHFALLLNPNDLSVLLDSYVERDMIDERLVWNLVASVTEVAKFWLHQKGIDNEENRKFAVKYVRHNLLKIYNALPAGGTVFDKTGTTEFDVISENLVAWLEYNMSHFEFSVGTVPGYLTHEGPSELFKQQASYFNLGQSSRADGEVDKILNSPDKLGDFGQCKAVSEVMAASKYAITGSPDPKSPIYYARQDLYTGLLWSFYNGLMLNPNISDKIKESVLAKHNSFLDSWPQLKPTWGSPRSKRSELIDEVSENVSPGPDSKALEKAVAVGLGGGNPIDALEFGGDKVMKDSITSSHAELGATVQSILTRVKNGQDASDIVRKNIQASETELELLRKLKLTEVVSMNEKLSSKVDGAIDFVEAITAAAQNAAKFGTFEGLYGKYSKLPETEWNENFSNLETMVEALIGMKIGKKAYLPKELITRHDVLLRGAKEMYLSWALLLHRPPTVVKASDDKYKVRALTSDFYAEKQDPLVFEDFMIDNYGSDKNSEAFVAPEIMKPQVIRVEIIMDFVQGLLASDVDEEIAGLNPGAILKDLNTSRNAIYEYYKSDEYDGRTKFDLEAALKKGSSYSAFVKELLAFMKTASKSPQIGNSNDGACKDDPILEYVEKVHGEPSKRRLRNLPYHLLNADKSSFNSLVALLEGTGGSPDESTIKRSGLAIAKYLRAINRPMESRGVMLKMLRPYITRNKNKMLLENKARVANVRGKARKAARNAVYSQMATSLPASGDTILGFKKYNSFTYEDQIREAHIRRYSKLSGGQEPPKAWLDAQMSRSWSVAIDMQTEIMFEALMEQEAFGDLDTVGDIVNRALSGAATMSDLDREIYKEYVDSADPFDETWNLSDETGIFAEKIFEGAKSVAKEVVICIAAAAAGNAVGSAVRGLGAALAGMEWLAGLGRAGRLLAGVVVAGGEIAAIGLEAGIFSYSHTFLSNFAGGDAKYLHEIAETDGSGAAWARFFATAAMFGAFRVTGAVQAYVNQGEAGQAAIRAMFMDPTKVRVLKQILAKTSGKDTELALSNLKQILATGKVNGKAVPEDMLAVFRPAATEIDMLRSRYRGVLDVMKDGKVKKVCVFLFETLQFDLLAITLGELAHHQLVEGNLDNFEMWSAEAWFSRYTMALSFKAAFGIVKKGGEWVRGKDYFGSVSRDLMDVTSKRGEVEGELARIQESSATSQQISSVKAEQAQLRSDARSLSAEAKAERQAASKLKSGPEKAQALNRADAKSKRAGLLRGRATALGGEIVRLEAQLEVEMRPLKERLAELKAQDEGLQAALKVQVELGDFPISSRVAKRMPRWLRRSLFEQYRDAEGNFIGRKGLAKLMLSGEKGFQAGLRMIRVADRLILSADDVIVIALQKEGVDREAFLKTCSRNMSRRQMKMYMETVKYMHFSPETAKGFDVKRPEETPLSWMRRNSKRIRNGLLVVMTSGIVSLEVAFGSSGEPVGNRETPSHIVKAAEFNAKGGRFYIPSKAMESLPEASPTSETLVMEAGPTVTAAKEAPAGAKELPQKRSKDVFAVGQRSIFDGLLKAGMPAAAVADMEKQQKEIPPEFSNDVRFFATFDGGQWKPRIAAKVKQIAEKVAKQLEEAFKSDMDYVLNEADLKTISSVQPLSASEARMMMDRIPITGAGIVLTGNPWAEWKDVDILDSIKDLLDFDPSLPIDHLFFECIQLLTTAGLWGWAKSLLGLNGPVPFVTLWGLLAIRRLTDDSKILNAATWAPQFMWKVIQYFYGKRSAEESGSRSNTEKPGEVVSPIPETVDDILADLGRDAQGNNVYSVVNLASGNRRILNNAFTDARNAILHSKPKSHAEGAKLLKDFVTWRYLSLLRGEKIGKLKSESQATYRAIETLTTEFAGMANSARGPERSELAQKIATEKAKFSSEEQFSIDQILADKKELRNLEGNNARGDTDNARLAELQRTIREREAKLTMQSVTEVNKIKEIDDKLAEKFNSLVDNKLALKMGFEAFRNAKAYDAIWKVVEPILKERGYADSQIEVAKTGMKRLVDLIKTHNPSSTHRELEILRVKLNVAEPRYEKAVEIVNAGAPASAEADFTKWYEYQDAQVFIEAYKSLQSSEQELVARIGRWEKGKAAFEKDFPAGSTKRKVWLSALALASAAAIPSIAWVVNDKYGPFFGKDDEKKESPGSGATKNTPAQQKLEAERKAAAEKLQAEGKGIFAPIQKKTDDPSNPTDESPAPEEAPSTNNKPESGDAQKPEENPTPADAPVRGPSEEVLDAQTLERLKEAGLYEDPTAPDSTP